MAAEAIDERIAFEVARRPPAPEPVEIDADDEGRAVHLFFAMDTQWNWVAGPVVNGVGGFGMRVGLRYETIAPVAAMIGITADAQLLVDLRAIEAEALTALAEAAR